MYLCIYLPVYLPVYLCIYLHIYLGFRCGSAGKNLLAMQETWVQSQGWEDPLKEEMATHSSVLSRIIPWTEETSRVLSMGSQRVGLD